MSRHHKYMPLPWILVPLVSSARLNDISQSIISAGWYYHSIAVVFPMLSSWLLLPNCRRDLNLHSYLHGGSVGAVYNTHITWYAHHCPRFHNTDLSVGSSVDGIYTQQTSVAVYLKRQVNPDFFCLFQNGQHLSGSGKTMGDISMWHWLSEQGDH